jgi:ABC-type phosphate transport system substrate-binding protein
MNKTLRGAVGAVAVSVGLLATAIPAGAFTIDPIMKNDRNVKTAPSPQLNMGGSSFDGPLVLAAQTQWNADTHKAPFASYATSKSGTGRAGAISGSLNIGFSDFPMNQGGDCDLGHSPVVGATAPCTSYTDPTGSVAQYVQAPVILGGVAVIFHITGLTNAAKSWINANGLTLTGLTVGQIFAGKITNWNSAAIASKNPGLLHLGHSILPNEKIQIESRTSGSGTTYMYTDYLSKVDHADFPAGTSAAFTKAVATNANSGLLAAAVAATPGAVGYVEYGYAVANGLQSARLINKSGKSVGLTEGGIIQAATVGLAAIKASAACGHAFKTTTPACFSINNELGPTVYPISGFSYAMVKKVQTNKNAAISIVKFLDFLSHQGGGTSATNTYGQDLADANGYAPLPLTMQALDRSLLLTVTFGGHAVLNATD